MSTELVSSFINGFNVQTIVSMAGILWFFKSHFDAKFDKIDAKFDKIDAKFDKIDQKMQDQSQRTDRLYEMFIDLLKEGNKK